MMGRLVVGLDYYHALSTGQPESHNLHEEASWMWQGTAGMVVWSVGLDEE